MGLSLDGTDWLMLLKLSVAAVCGLLVGIERGYRGKPAGIRTNLLICLGSCLFMLVSEHVAYSARASGFPGPDPARIAAQVVTGIGFLGAGAILRNGNSVSGLTTAASIWCVSAIGLAAGAGMYGLCALATLGIVATLEFLVIIEHRVGQRRFRYYKLEVFIKNKSRVQDVRKTLRTMQIPFFDESLRKILGETHYSATVQCRGDLEKTLEDQIAGLRGVRDIVLLSQGLDT